MEASPRVSVAVERDVLFAVARDASGLAWSCGVLALLPHCAEFRRMYVRPGTRGQAIGAGIARFLEQQAARRGHATVTTGSGIGRTEALSPYERLGYEGREVVDIHAPDSAKAARR